MGETVEKRPQAGEPRKKSGLIIRILLFVVLGLLLLAAFRWRALAGEYKRGVALYEEGKFREAAAVIEPLLDKPLARFRIYAKARQTLGFCKAEMASEIALNDRSTEGYSKALKLLEEAKALAGSTPEIERRIKEYSEYLDRAREQGKEAPAAVTAPTTTLPAAPTK